MYHKHNDKHIWRRRSNGFYVCCVAPSGIAFFRNRLLYILIKRFLASQCVPSLPFFYEDIGTFLTEATAGTILKVFICQPQSQLFFFFFFPCTSNRKWVGDLSYCCVISACKFNLFIATTVAFKIENKYDALVKIMYLRLAERNYKTDIIRICVCFPSSPIFSEEN